MRTKSFEKIVKEATKPSEQWIPDKTMLVVYYHGQKKPVYGLFLGKTVGGIAMRLNWNNDPNSATEVRSAGVKILRELSPLDAITFLNYLPK
ncbi:MAG: hypothetical protein AAB691_00620 [Patescibacteria group bacterium]|mgnify:CR=1 FL=1